MEPGIVSSNAQHTLTATETSDIGTRTSENVEQPDESFVATIVRLDQATAEQVFRAAKQ